MNILVAVISYFFLHHLGKSIFNILFSKNFSKNSVSDIEIDNFYPLISLFFVGNLILILNFFIAIKLTVNFLLLFSLFLILFDIIKNKFELNINFKTFIYFIFTPAVLGISSYGVWLGWDTGLYHIPHQYLIRENTIIFGLTNLNIWFGWSSIIEYISSVLWLENNYILLRTLEIVFFCFFFNLIFYFFYQKNKLYRNVAICLVLFSFLDNFGYLGGGNGFLPILSVGKYDSALGVLFFTFSIMILNSIINKEFDKQSLFFYVCFSLFALQVKQTGVYLIFLLLPYLFLYIKKNKSKITDILKINLFPISIFFIWIFKNAITTSCLFFPVRITCLNFLPWFERVQLNYLEETMIYSPISLNSSIPIYEQFSIWFNFSKNSQFFINFPLSLAIVIIASLAIFQKRVKIHTKFVNILFILFIMLNTVFWYLSNYGNVRYGFGLWLLVISYIGFLYKDSELRIHNQKIISSTFILVFIFSLIQIPRSYSYESLLSLKFAPYVLPIDYGTAYNQSEYGWGVYPDTVQCWDIPECKIEDKDVEPRNYLNGIMFLPDGETGN